MSNYTHKPGTGVLFKNDKKTSANQPDMTGTAMVNGKEMRVAAWSKEANGKKFLSLKLSEVEKPKDETPSTPPEQDTLEGLF